MKSTLILIALSTGCYSPGYNDCEVTCASAQACPSGYSCESNFCVAEPGTSCGAGSDGGMDGGDANTMAWGMATPVMFMTGVMLGPDHDPSLSDNMLELYFIRQVGNSGDIYSVRRGATTDLWPNPVQNTVLNGSTSDQTPELAGDGLTIYFSSDRSGASTLFDVWSSTRTTATATFGTPTTVGAFNSASVDDSPAISRDGLTMVWSSVRNGTADLFIATRPSTSPTAGWSMPMAMTALNDTSARDESPFLSTNKLTIFFSSNRSGDYDLYQATRATVMDQFGPPTPIAELNTPNVADTAPWVSPDGRHIYFSRVVGGQFTLMEATR